MKYSISRSRLMVARFCAGERVSVASFYHWGKKLGQAVLRRRRPAGPGIFRQIAVVPAAPAVVPPCGRSRTCGTGTSTGA